MKYGSTRILNKSLGSVFIKTTLTVFIYEPRSNSTSPLIVESLPAPLDHRHLNPHLDCD